VSAFQSSVSRRRVLASGSAMAVGLAAVGPLQRALAQDASPVASPEEGGGMPPLPEGATVIAQGLWNPGDLAFGDDGTLYIAETGVAGGDESIDEPSVATPNALGTPPAAQAMAIPPQVSMVSSDGTQSVLSKDAGGVGIAFRDGVVYVAYGGGSVGSGMSPLPIENTVNAIDVTSGEARVLAELGPYEQENNPDGTDINPNLYGMAIDSSGLIYQADAGGNTIYTIDPTSGSFQLFAVVPNLTDLTGATPTAEEEAQQPGPRQPVPTSIVIGDDGMINVFLLCEGWPGPSIITFATDGTYTSGISGLSMTVNAAMGPDGLMYVSQLTADFSGEQPAPGNVFRIGADGTVEPVVQGLFFPHGIAFDADGNLYVATNSIISAPDAALGMVLRFDGIASPAA